MKFHILEWVFETLNKRVSQGMKLKDLFICLPYHEESEINWDLFSLFNKMGRAQGNDLARDYPALYRLFNGSDRKEETSIRVFFLSTSRLPKPLILNVRKYKYPRVNQLIKIPFLVH
jgi:hypothetical protein